MVESPRRMSILRLERGPGRIENMCGFGGAVKNPWPAWGGEMVLPGRLSPPLLCRKPWGTPKRPPLHIEGVWGRSACVELGSGLDESLLGSAFLLLRLFQHPALIC